MCGEYFLSAMISLSAALFGKECYNFRGIKYSIRTVHVLYILAIIELSDLKCRSLSKMGCRWRGLLSNTLPIFPRIIELSPMGPQALSGIVYGLSKLGVSYQDVPSSFVESLHTSVAIYSFVNEQSVSNFIYGLGCMGLSLSSFSTPHADNLLRVINATLPVATEQGFVQILYGLAKMNDVHFEETSMMPTVLSKAILCSAAERLPLMNVQGLCSTVWSLGQLQNSANMPLVLQDAYLSLKNPIHVSINKQCQDMNEQGVSNLFLGLAKVGNYFSLLYFFP